MTEETNIPTKPEDRITVKVNGAEKEVFMSGGLIRTLLPYFRDFEDFADIFSRPEEQNQLIIETLKDRTPAGRAIKDQTIFDFEMSMEESNKLVNWVVEHSLHFFIESVTQAKDVFVKNTAKIQGLAKLMESLTGTSALPESKPSAGDSTQSQATSQ